MTTENTIILHNPRCSKSRETLSLLRENGIEPEIHEYLKAPLTENALRKLMAELDGDATTLIRHADAKKAGIVEFDETTSEDEIVKLLCKHPELMQRPIVRHRGHAIIGRPPLLVLDIFDSTAH